MIHDLKPYPIYKDSGVPWLGTVPEHWEVWRQRECVQMLVSNIDKHTIESEVPVRLCNYTDVYKNDRITDRLGFMRATATPDEIERFRLRLGDVIITKDSESWTDIGVSALVEYEAPDLVCGYHLALLRPRNEVVSGGFLLRAFQSRGVACQYHVGANGVTRYGLSHATIKNVLIPVPPLAEQAPIVRFLDHVDRRIKRYVRAKQKLIALLNEQKQAIIHRAVTRGLDPNVRLKPSGVEGLGDVPEHWEIRRLGQIATIFNGSTPSRMKQTYWQNGTVPWLSSGKVNDYVVRAASELVTELAVKECSLNMVPRGALVFGLVGQGKTRGMSAVLDIDACINQNLAAVIPRHELRGKYLHHFLTAFYKSLREFGRGGNQEALNCEIVGRFRLPVPPLDEQEALCNYLEKLLHELFLGEQRIDSAIQLLREYRTRLIADVVTGKLDVRDVVAQLPEEDDELELLEDTDTMEEEADEAEQTTSGEV